MGFWGNSEVVNDDIFAYVKDILKNARKDEKVVLVTPYIKFDEKIRDCIEDALERGVKVILLVRKDAERNPLDSEFLGNNNVEVRELEYLHAKVYLSENVALITSQNLYDFSDRKSKEIGFITDEPKYVKPVSEQVDRWLAKAERVSNKDLLLSNSSRRSDIKRSPELTANVSNKPVSVSAGSPKTQIKATSGYCIRCQKSKTYNPKYPLCDDCYNIWAEFKNKRYREKVCHRCGKAAETSVEVPLCKTCA